MFLSLAPYVISFLGGAVACAWMLKRAHMAALPTTVAQAKAMAAADLAKVQTAAPGIENDIKKL